MLESAKPRGWQLLAGAVALAAILALAFWLRWRYVQEISLYVDEFAGEGIMFEGVAGPPGYAAMALPLTGSRHAEVMADYRRLAQFGLMVGDTSRGRVRDVAGRGPIHLSLIHI